MVILDLNTLSGTTITPVTFYKGVPPLRGVLVTRERHLWKLNTLMEGPVTNVTMKEDLIAEKAEFVSEKNKSDQGSVVFKMVHIVAIGLPLLVIWLAQPGSSKL